MRENPCRTSQRSGIKRTITKTQKAVRVSWQAAVDLHPLKDRSVETPRTCPLTTRRMSGALVASFDQLSRHARQISLAHVYTRDVLIDIRARTARRECGE